MSNVDDYDYELPRDLIAQQPLPRRADARLMVVDRARDSIQHRHVRDLPHLLREGDCLALNDTRVVPARLVGRRALTGGRWEGLFLSRTPEGWWRLLAKTRGRLQPGEEVVLVNARGEDDVSLGMMTKLEGGVWIARPTTDEETFGLLDRVGRVPLPHYIRHGQMSPADRERYQTVFAKQPGSVAAPTAGLHFTPELLGEIRRHGISAAHVTLHVGIGTFRPMSVDRLEEHVMHSEWCELSAPAAEAIQACKDSGGRVVAVGTTVTRVLETVTRDGPLRPWSGETQLFIHPPFEFRAVDVLLTNFHLPRSTLLVLVRTFGGDKLIRRAYAEAIEHEYRFYSYGDAMLIV